MAKTAAAGLQPRPEETRGCGNTGSWLYQDPYPGSLSLSLYPNTGSLAEVYNKGMIPVESRLLNLPIQRKTLNSLTWDIWLIQYQQSGDAPNYLSFVARLLYILPPQSSFSSCLKRCLQDSVFLLPQIKLYLYRPVHTVGEGEGGMN